MKDRDEDLRFQLRLSVADLDRDRLASSWTEADLAFHDAHTNS